MPGISTLLEFKECVQANFEGNEASLQAFGKTYSKQLKAQLIESGERTPSEVGAPDGSWGPMDAPGWYTNREGENPNSFFLDASAPRIWKLYSLIDATVFKSAVDRWVEKARGVDKVWLTRDHMFHLGKEPEWAQRGVGITFNDGLAEDDENQANLSLKAWHGAYDRLPELRRLIDLAQKQFAVYSVRWQKKTTGAVTISAEWYSDGRVTVNRGADVDEVLSFITEMSVEYGSSLEEATNLRDQGLGAFEYNFSQEVNLDAFSATVARGTGDMKLWLVEVESEPDFRRFKGVDLHTWDRVLLDLGERYAYLTIPRKGCVNAVPRLAVVQGEDNTGKTEVFYDGEKVFA